MFRLTKKNLNKNSNKKTTSSISNEDTHIAKDYSGKNQNGSCPLTCPCSPCSPCNPICCGCCTMGCCSLLAIGGLISLLTCGVLGNDCNNNCGQC